MVNSWNTFTIELILISRTFVKNYFACWVIVFFLTQKKTHSSQIISHLNYKIMYDVRSSQLIGQIQITVNYVEE